MRLRCDLQWPSSNSLYKTSVARLTPPLMKSWNRLLSQLLRSCNSILISRRDHPGLLHAETRRRFQKMVGVTQCVLLLKVDEVRPSRIQRTSTGPEWCDRCLAHCCDLHVRFTLRARIEKDTGPHSHCQVMIDCKFDPRSFWILNFARREVGPSQFVVPICGAEVRISVLQTPPSLSRVALVDKITVLKSEEF